MPQLTIADIEKLWADLRPKLHRYCARMVGSSIDSEDVLQETMAKALGAIESSGPIHNPDAWLFRIAHNAALDWRRGQQREPALLGQGIHALPALASPGHDLAHTSLRTFLRLPPLQRSAVILKDVLGHSIEEIAGIVGVTEPSAKSALQRGRAQLRELAQEPEELMLPRLSEEAQARLFAYVDGFRTGNFDAVRAMLSEEVQLDLVGIFRRKGKKEVSEYYQRYAEAGHWIYAAGVVQGEPAMLVYDRGVSLHAPAYFVALTFNGDRVSAVRDFLSARYASEGADVVILETRHLSQ